MDFKDAYPEYLTIEEHIRRARLERSIAMAHLIAGAVDGAVRGLRRLFDSFSTLKADAPLTLLKEPVHR